MQRFRILLCVVACVVVGLSGPAFAEKEKQAQTPPQLKGSGLPVPRFVTLKSAETRVRTGPGNIYPVEWIFTRKGTPVEITAEFDTWRRIRDWEGAEGWVHQSLISGQRAVVVTGTVRALRRKASTDSQALAQVEPGVTGRLDTCKKAWCLITIDDIEGWMRQEDIWGVYPNETFN